MDNLKAQLKEIINNQIENMDFDIDYLSKTTLELKLNTIIENTLNKITLIKSNNNIQVPIHKTSNDNIFDGVILDSGKSSDIDFSDFKEIIELSDKPQVVKSTTIPSNFILDYELRAFAKVKSVQDVDRMFEDFTLYYQSKGTINNNWSAVWKRWVLNNNQYKNHLIKTTIKEDMSLSKTMSKFAKDYIDKDNIELEFIKFKNHYLGTGDIKVSWEKVWENWAIKYKQFKPKQQSSKSQQKQDYRWDFRKAKEVSDKIKDWLEFEKGINWLDDFYWKGIPIQGIGWQKVIHPDFNKEELLLYKIDSIDGNFMLANKSDDIIDAEILEVK